MILLEKKQPWWIEKTDRMIVTAQKFVLRRDYNKLCSSFTDALVRTCLVRSKTSRFSDCSVIKNRDTKFAESRRSDRKEREAKTSARAEMRKEVVEQKGGKMMPCDRAVHANIHCYSHPLSNFFFLFFFLSPFFFLFFFSGCHDSEPEFNQYDGKTRFVAPYSLVRPLFHIERIVRDYATRQGLSRGQSCLTNYKCDIG